MMSQFFHNDCCHSNRSYPGGEVVKMRHLFTTNSLKAIKIKIKTPRVPPVIVSCDVEMIRTFSSRVTQL